VFLALTHCTSIGLGEMSGDYKNAPPSIKDLTDVADVLINLVRNEHLRRALFSVNPKPHLNFWILIYNSLIDLVVLDWCKLFGSDDASHQPTHWKISFPTLNTMTFVANYSCASERISGSHPGRR
jgi:hypothetical protein